jgi:hypothetical protein
MKLSHHSLSLLRREAATPMQRHDDSRCWQTSRFLKRILTSTLSRMNS